MSETTQPEVSTEENEALDNAESNREVGAVVSSSLDEIESSLETGDESRVQQLLKAVRKVYKDRPQELTLEQFLKLDELDEKYKSQTGSSQEGSASEVGDDTQADEVNSVVSADTTQDDRGVTDSLDYDQTEKDTLVPERRTNGAAPASGTNSDVALAAESQPTPLNSDLNVEVPNDIPVGEPATFSDGETTANIAERGGTEVDTQGENDNASLVREAVRALDQAQEALRKLQQHQSEINNQ
ncbi:MAG: hypothetical protein WDZ94_02925 [Patescibacteria group bacterium]